jgi:hypothetical protein
MDWARWERFAPLTGIVAVVLWILGVIIEASTDYSEKDTPEEILAVLQEDANTLIAAGVAFAFGIVFFIWFLGSLRAALYEAEGGVGRLTGVKAPTSPRQSPAPSSSTTDERGDDLPAAWPPLAAATRPSGPNVGGTSVERTHGVPRATHPPKFGLNAGLTATGSVALNPPPSTAVPAGHGQPPVGLRHGSGRTGPFLGRRSQRGYSHHVCLVPAASPYRDEIEAGPFGVPERRDPEARSSAARSAQVSKSLKLAGGRREPRSCAGWQAGKAPDGHRERSFLSFAALDARSWADV